MNKCAMVRLLLAQISCPLPIDRLPTHPPLAPFPAAASHTSISRLFEDEHVAVFNEQVRDSGFVGGRGSVDKKYQVITPSHVPP
jgi:hypothetical protein